MTLTFAQQKILKAIQQGETLKAHRDLEGNKIYQLHPLQGVAADVSGDDVHALTEFRLIDSNKKFPAATFWLTELGKALLLNL